MIIIEETMCLAICIFLEGRGETEDGQVAIGHVVLNRAIKSGTSVSEVIYKPYQFSWTNKDQQPDIKYEEFKYLGTCLSSAIKCYGERLRGYTMEGADHYFNPKVVLPSWAKKMKLICRRGNHDFYKA